MTRGVCPKCGRRGDVDERWRMRPHSEPRDKRATGPLRYCPGSGQTCAARRVNIAGLSGVTDPRGREAPPKKQGKH